MAKVINATDNIEIREPIIYKTTREFRGTVLDFRNIFNKCVNEVFFTEYKRSKVLDIAITQKEYDNVSLNIQELVLINQLMIGIYNIEERQKIIELFQRLWGESKIFRGRIGGVIKALETQTLAKEKQTIFPYYKNPVEIVVAKDYFRYHLHEIYYPIRNYLLNLLTEVYMGRIYSTSSPFIFKIEETHIPKDLRKVMVGESIYEITVNN